MIDTTGEDKAYCDPQFEGDASWSQSLSGLEHEAASHTASTVRRKESTNAQLNVSCFLSLGPQPTEKHCIHLEWVFLPQGVNLV